MTDPTLDLLPEGLEDRLPPRAAASSRVTRAILDTMAANGYERVAPPLVEFEKSMAARMNGVQPRRMFRFTDPISLRTLALRSDITVQVGRIAATGLANAPRPLRLCYAGQVTRIMGDNFDHRRESLQLGAELIGTDSAAAAGEAVSLALEALEAAGAKDLTVDLTLPDLVDTLAADTFPLAEDQIAAVRRELDAKDAGGLKAAGGEAYLPLLYATGPFEDAIAKLDALDAGGALASRIDGLRQVAERIGGNARVTLDPSERHGFEYQSWFGFTVYAGDARAALGRGGTYAIQGPNEPATGFSLYPEPLIETAAANAETPDTVFLPIGHDRAVAARLRAEGMRTIAALSEADDAAALGCSHLLNGENVVIL